ncbi:60S ribosomal protein L17-1 [Raphanus sativus]|nr:60S ribosomal protein L17-1 [Raphanus sativus]
MQSSGIQKIKVTVKSTQFRLDVFKNVESNAEVKVLDVDAFFISHIQLNQAEKQRWRTYRVLHSVLTLHFAAYMSNPCHIELILSKKEEPLRKRYVIHLNGCM